MTLHKTDHLSKKDIQKRKSTFSHFELQNFFFHTHFKLMMSDVFSIFWHIISQKTFKIFIVMWEEFFESFLAPKFKFKMWEKKCKTSFCPYLPIHHDNEGGFLSSVTHRFCITFTGFSTAEVFEFCSQFQWVSTSVLKKMWKIKNLEFFIHFGFFFLSLMDFWSILELYTFQDF